MRLLATDAVRESSKEVEIRFPLDLVALHAMDRDQVLAFAGDAPIVTDDNLRVEYAAPLWLHTDISVQNWDELLAAAHVPWGALSDEPLDWLDLAETYQRLEDPRRAALVRARVLGVVDAGGPAAGRGPGAPGTDPGGAMTVYEQLGREDGVRALVDTFYDTMDTLPEAATIRAMHAVGSEREPAEVVDVPGRTVRRTTIYEQERGHPRLRARHLPFVVGPDEARQWVTCMDRALADRVTDDALRAELAAFFRQVATHMIEPLIRPTSCGKQGDRV